MHPRLRTWLSLDTLLGVALGSLRTPSRKFRAPGPVGKVALKFGDWAALTVQASVLPLRDTRGGHAFAKSNLCFGLRIGGTPGVVVGPLVMAVAFANPR